MTDSDKPRILIVDDNPFNRELLKEILESEGFFSEEAPNGKEAIRRMRDSAFKLILMDLLMPGMDGFETIRRIRRMGIKTPIIIVSAMDSKEDRQRCLEAGGNDFLPKPIDAEKVKALIEQYEEDKAVPFDDLNSFPRKDNKLLHPLSLNFSDYHVLLVEEDDIIGNRYCHFFMNLGFDVSRVCNGNQAWDLFLRHPHKFDIIISNVFTSGIDGFGILAKIKRDYLNVMVFLYAKTYDADIFQLAIQLGADGVTTEAEFENSFIDLIESAIYQSAQKGSRTQTASTASQVRKAQEQLIRYGCPEPCNSIDVAYSSLSDAGGDMAWCRRFNRAGRCGIMLGDVAGHSVMSSYISAISLGILTSTWDKNQAPRKLLRIINAELNKPDYDHYHLCATVLLWDRYRKKIKIATAGNPGGLLVNEAADASPEIHELEGGGMCLGLIEENQLFLNDRIKFDKEGYLFLFSDGITKAQIAEVLTSGSVHLNRESIRGVSREILDRILEKYGQNDDMILITLKSFFSRSDMVRSFRGEKGDHDGQELHYEFLSSYEEADKACKWAADYFTPDKLPSGRDPCFISLALREALINAVKHGNNFNPAAFVDLSLFFRPGELRIEVSDEGPGFNLPDKIEKIEEINLLRSGGRGLPVMWSLSDSLEVSGGTISLIFREKRIRMKKHCPPAECGKKF
ncbi:response regulator [Desulfonema magnum]|nr:response regulator [Desulfonema magnum]